MRIHSIGFKVGAKSACYIMANGTQKDIFLSMPRSKWSVPAVYLQCHAVYTAGTLQPMQCTCSMAAFCTLHIHWQQVEVYLQCTCSLHCSYTACTLHFGLGGRMKVLQYSTGCAGECSEVTKSTVPYLLKDVSCSKLWSHHYIPFTLWLIL